MTALGVAVGSLVLIACGTVVRLVQYGSALLNWQRS